MKAPFHAFTLGTATNWGRFEGSPTVLVSPPSTTSLPIRVDSSGLLALGWIAACWVGIGP